MFRNAPQGEFSVKQKVTEKERSWHVTNHETNWNSRWRDLQPGSDSGEGEMISYTVISPNIRPQTTKSTRWPINHSRASCTHWFWAASVSSPHCGLCTGTGWCYSDPSAPQTPWTGRRAGERKGKVLVFILLFYFVVAADSWGENSFVKAQTEAYKSSVNIYVFLITIYPHWDVLE